MTKAFIALDWGTTSFRAYHVSTDGVVMHELSDANGIMAVRDQTFDDTLEQHIGAWDKALPILASGMITSRQGWVELPYVDAPAGPDEIAKSIHHHISNRNRNIYFVTGLHLRGGALGHDVMRGEETQVVGSLGEAQHFIAPGTHSKWIDVSDYAITNFATYMTGESFALFRQHSILGRLMTGDENDDTAFVRGLDLAKSDPAGLLHNLFSTRSLGLFDDIEPAALSSYLSGLLIGTEVAHALQSRSPDAGYVVLASPKIGGRYAKALDYFGIQAHYGNALATVKGLRRLGQTAGIL